VEPIAGVCWKRLRRIVSEGLKKTNYLTLIFFPAEIPHCLDSRLTDGGKFVSRTHRPRSTPQKLFLLLVLISVRG
jgi:hypothetical protein